MLRRAFRKFWKNRFGIFGIAKRITESDGETRCNCEKSESIHSRCRSPCHIEVTSNVSIGGAIKPGDLEPFLIPRHIPQLEICREADVRNAISFASDDTICFHDGVVYIGSVGEACAAPCDGVSTQVKCRRLRHGLIAERTIRIPYQYIGPYWRA